MVGVAATMTTVTRITTTTMQRQQQQKEHQQRRGALGSTQEQTRQLRSTKGRQFKANAFDANINASLP
jgi:hypothetical protein